MEVSGYDLQDISKELLLLFFAFNVSKLLHTPVVILKVKCGCRWSTSLDQTSRQKYQNMQDKVDSPAKLKKQMLHS